MNIVIFSHTLQGGGAERVTSHLANAWVADGYAVTIITLTSVESDSYLLVPSVRRIALNLISDSGGFISALLANMRRVLILRKQLKQLNGDVLIGIGTSASVHVVLASIGLKCRSIISERVHPPMVSMGFFWSFLRWLSYRWADVAVGQTEETRIWLEKSCGCRYTAVIPNPVVLPLPDGLPKLSPDLIVRKNRKLLLATGRLEVQKGFSILIDTFSMLASNNPDWDLVIIGDGFLYKELEQQCIASGLMDRIWLLGRVGNMGDWYQRADLYVMSSLFEGFPNTLLEAMSSGCASVSFDCDTGPRDIIRHGVNGLLVKPVGDARALAVSLGKLMQDDTSRSLYSENAVAIKQVFSLEKVLAKWQALFDKKVGD